MYKQLFKLLNKALFQKFFQQFENKWKNVGKVFLPLSIRKIKAKILEFDRGT
ncbi:hypothetical protein AT05_08075 [Schleiferia thermophila str. Yellowstone]|nr:hypothetical protein AT05_08075 [Schleiferia thermophila str. Yellowstone]